MYSKLMICINNPHKIQAALISCQPKNIFVLTHNVNILFNTIIELQCMTLVQFLRFVSVPFNE